MKTYPKQGPRKAFGTFQKFANQTPSQLKAEQLALLNSISEKAHEDGKEPVLTKRWRAQILDCFLYAQDDQYK